MSDGDDTERYGIKIIDGLTSRTHRAFRSELAFIIKGVGGAEENLPFLGRCITKDRDWYALMKKWYGALKGYPTETYQDAAQHLREASKHLSAARSFLVAIEGLDMGMRTKDGHQWSNTDQDAMYRDQPRGLATFTVTKDGGKTRYWLSTLNEPGHPGLYRASLCHWSEKEVMEVIERNSCEYVDNETFEGAVTAFYGPKGY